MSTEYLASFTGKDVPSIQSGFCHSSIALAGCDTCQRTFLACHPSGLGGSSLRCRNATALRAHGSLVGDNSKVGAGQAILSFENISTADGMTLGATDDKNWCSSVPIWMKPTSEPHWMLALPNRRIGSIRRVGRTSATRFRLGITLITRTMAACPSLARAQCLPARATSRL